MGIKENKSNDSGLRVNFDEMEDVGGVTHYKGKPFTGVTFSLHQNSEVEDEVQMLEGLKHGKASEYSDDGSLVMESIYKNDEIDDFGDFIWTDITLSSFNKDIYEYDRITTYIKAVKKNHQKNFPDWPDIIFSKFNDRVLEKLITNNKVRLPDEIVLKAEKEIQSQEIDELMDKFRWDKNDDEKRAGLKEAIESLQIKQDNHDKLKKEVSGL